MYVLCSNYKDDQVHAPFLMRRRALTSRLAANDRMLSTHLGASADLPPWAVLVACALAAGQPRASGRGAPPTRARERGDRGDAASSP